MMAPILAAAGRGRASIRAAGSKRFPREIQSMKIELSQEQVLLQEMVRRFAREVVQPQAREIDASGEFPLDFYQQAGELGLAGVSVPEAYGGAGMDGVSYCLVIEEISRVCATSGV